jgi:P pilus assembly chaperone PapD
MVRVKQLCYIRVAITYEPNSEVHAMKTALRLFSVPCFLLLTVSLALGAPRATIENPTFDFGSILQGKNVEHVFILKNDGDTPLTVGQVTTSCGCTVAAVSSRTVAPGKSSEIRATFNSRNFSGNINKSIAIHTNDPITPVYTLTIKGNVVEEIEISPRQLNLGEIKIGTSKDALVAVENKGKQAVTLTSVRSTMPQVAVKSGKTMIKPGRKATISVKVTPRKDDRFMGGYINVTTDSPSKPDFIIPVYATAVK